MLLRQVPIRKSGNRHILFMGGDRELVMFSGLLSASLLFTAWDLFAFMFAVALWVFCLRIFRRMAKADPIMRKVYLRNRKYKKYYPPRATPFRKNTVSQGNIYK